MRLPLFTLTGSALALSAAVLAWQVPSARAATTEAPLQATSIADQDISDAYIYLLGRLLILRQLQLDQQQGMGWNQLVHRKPGAVEWPNPNLDVVYSEGWVALDEGSCTLVHVPPIKARYYTVQFLNGWGETLANINERNFPDHPNGDFAVCLKGASVALPAGVQRLDLPARTARVLSRVELGSDWKEAEALQQQFSMKAMGTPSVPTVPATPLFDPRQLPGVEAFEAAQLALQEPDLNPGMEGVQAKVRTLASRLADPTERARIDQVIRTRAFADLAKAGPKIGPGTLVNGWVRPAVAGNYGSDYLTRTLVNYGGIWGNTRPEVNYYRAAVDAQGATLSGERTYTLTFTADQLPDKQVEYYWSVTATDAKTFRVLPNPLDRFVLNSHSPLQYGKDGSLTLYFGPQKPKDTPQGNWLPTVAGVQYRLLLRYYGAKDKVSSGTYFPPALSAQADVAPPRSVPVTLDTFIRAETDRYFSATVMRGGLGKFGHMRELMPVDRQSVVRANRDTLYSTAVFDLDAGPVTVTLPDADRRYMSLTAINENHEVLGMKYGAGTYRFDRKTAGTRYVLIGVRTLVDPASPTDVSKAWALQDGIGASQPAGPGQFEVPAWDKPSQDALRAALRVLGQGVPDSRGMFGREAKVDPVRHLVGSAIAWGGNPEKDAFYQIVTPMRNDGATPYRLTVGKVPVGAFWSVSVYNAQGYFVPNASQAYSLNSLTAKQGEDGSIDIRFGGCTAQVANCLPIMQGWNYMVRYYLPDSSIVEGRWKLPEAQPAS